MKSTCFLSLAGLTLGLSVSSARAEITCPPYPPNVSEKARNVKSDIDASAGRLGSIKAVEIQIKTEVEAKNLFEKFPHVDKVLMLQILASSTCGMLEKSRLSDEEKIKRWEHFQDKFMELEFKK